MSFNIDQRMRHLKEEKWEINKPILTDTDKCGLVSRFWLNKGGNWKGQQVVLVWYAKKGKPGKQKRGGEVERGRENGRKTFGRRKLVSCESSVSPQRLVYNHCIALFGTIKEPPLEPSVVLHCCDWEVIIQFDFFSLNFFRLNGMGSHQTFFE